jgi:hypothetical protein
MNFNLNNASRQDHKLETRQTDNGKPSNDRLKELAEKHTAEYVNELVRSIAKASIIDALTELRDEMEKERAGTYFTEQIARQAADAANTLKRENNQLRAENETFRNAQKACEDCDGLTMAELKQLRAKLAAAEQRVEELKTVQKEYFDAYADEVKKTTYLDARIAQLEEELKVFLTEVLAELSPLEQEEDKPVRIGRNTKLCEKCMTLHPFNEPCPTP